MSVPYILPFDFQPRTRIVFGPGRIADLGKLTAELNCSRALVVSDPGIVEAGHTARGISALQSAGLTTHLFDAVHENPTTDDVESGLIFAQTVQPDLIVAIGGGSSMDCAKGINFLYTNGGRMQDYWGRDKARRDLLPMIAVPTTAGTGSEAQSFALISDAATHVKMACGDRRAAFRIAILDPELTLTQPPRVTALTGIDAISHALETSVTNVRTPVSTMLSREAWRMLSGAFTRVLEQPDDLDARGRMQVGACLAGLAIENSMLGAAHALANPLTARYGIVHGQAIAVVLPHVVRFNASGCQDTYAELLRINATALAPQNAGAVLADRLATWVAQAGLSVRLSELNVPHQDLKELAAAAAEQWTGTFNPRKVGTEELLGLYEAAY
ncbi:MAG: iron-containing alcohol dehydrogenase [Planctomycetes bacterium]|nr:iron-containing alcohol dehydrogenase [Planctomycetota bacterium]